MSSIDACTGLEWIDRDECLAWLAGDVVGRLAVVSGAAAEIFPVNYVLDGETIVFRTDPASPAGGSAAGPDPKTPGRRQPKRLRRVDSPLHGELGTNGLAVMGLTTLPTDYRPS